VVNVCTIFQASGSCKNALLKKENKKNKDIIVYILNLYNWKIKKNNIPTLEDRSRWHTIYIPYLKRKQEK